MKNTVGCYRMRHLAIIISILTISCNSTLQKKETVAIDSTILEIQSNTETAQDYDFQTSLFDQVKNFPHISDTTKFITELKDNCHLFDRESKFETINYFKKTKLYGSDKDFFILEYDFKSGSMASFPWKDQIIFDSRGKLINISSAIHLDIVKIFPNENPFLIGTYSTAKGNGRHQVYRIQNDTLENLYEGFLGNRPQTFDRYEDNTINEPYELECKIYDINKDGFNDIVFSGKLVFLQAYSDKAGWYDNELKNGKTISYSVDNPWKKMPITFEFLYNTKTKQFIEKEDYSKKYEYLFGNTK